MYSAVRKIHLWVGLILAIVLLSEAVTGLVLSEHWIIGQSQDEPPMSERAQSTEMKNAPPAKEGIRNADNAKPATSAFSALGFAKGLHQGRLGSLDLKWLVNLAALGIIVLTLTGVYLSIAPRQMRRNRR